MELKATTLGQHFAQHPYNRVKLLPAGIVISGENHQYMIPFNQLVKIQCKRGIVWGELEFELVAEKMVRLHGTDWIETQHFYQHLQQCWQVWSEEMAQVSADVLLAQVKALEEQYQQDHWLSRHQYTAICNTIRACFQAIPLPIQRLEEFTLCRDTYHSCLQWLDADMLAGRNQQWCRLMLQQEADFFSHVESSPLDPSQARAVINGDERVLMIAGAGSGKTAVLIARVAWLLHRREALCSQILLLSLTTQVTTLAQRIQTRWQHPEIQAITFQMLVLHIVNQVNKKPYAVSRYLEDRQARYDFLIQVWQQQCQDKKSQAKGWCEWLYDELGWEIEEGNYWQDKALMVRLAPKLDHWLKVIREYTGTRTELMTKVNQEKRTQLQKHLRLMAPLVKAWKGALKEEGALDLPGLVQQAIVLLEKKRFITPWKHILVDEFQNISPLKLRLLQALYQQNSHSCLFVVADDAKGMYCVNGAELPLIEIFNQYFGDGEQCRLTKSYRLDHRIGKIASYFRQQELKQFNNELNVRQEGSKNIITILPQDSLEALLNKMSGYVSADQRILILARHHYLKPELLNRAATRWPRLLLDFKTIHDSLGEQADYVIIVGLQQGVDGFPVRGENTVIDQVFLGTSDSFSDMEEEYLLYVALTRARNQVWLMQDPMNPSVFIEKLRRLGVPAHNKP